jgi:hypothetical protein
MAKQSGSRSARVARKKPAKSAHRRAAETGNSVRRTRPSPKSGARSSGGRGGTRISGVRPKTREGAPHTPKRLKRVGARSPGTLAPVSPSEREQALDVFERAFRALQQRQFSRAADLLAGLMRDYPEEKELHERARVYLTICQRQMAPPSHAPRTYEDRVFEATLAINQGSYDEGLSLLRRLETERGTDDHVQYMLTVVHSLRGELDQALTHLRQAVELNPENRFLAVQDADLESLRHEAGFAVSIDPQLGRRRNPARRK